MYRDLSYGECRVGTNGFALLRLHGGLGCVATGVVDEVIAELRSVLGQVDRPPFDRPARGRRLDVIEGYARWARVYDAAMLATVREKAPALDVCEGDLLNLPLNSGAIARRRFRRFGTRGRRRRRSRRRRDPPLLVV